MFVQFQWCYCVLCMHFSSTQESCFLWNKNESFLSILGYSKRKCSMWTNLNPLNKLLVTAQAPPVSAVILYGYAVHISKFQKVHRQHQPCCLYFLNFVGNRTSVWWFEGFQLCVSGLTLSLGNTDRIYEASSKLHQVYQYILDFLLNLMLLNSTDVQHNESRLDSLHSANVLYHSFSAPMILISWIEESWFKSPCLPSSFQMASK
jgi:hypothetical protein